MLGARSAEVVLLLHLLGTWRFKTSQGFTALHASSQGGHEGVVRMLLDARPGKCSGLKEKESPLIWGTEVVLLLHLQPPHQEESSPPLLDLHSQPNAVPCNQTCCYFAATLAISLVTFIYCAFELAFRVQDACL